MRDSDRDHETGFLLLRVFQRGELIEEFSGGNLVLDSRREIKAHLLAGDTTNNVVSKIGFGSNGAASALGNTLLATPFVKNIASVTYPNAGQATFNFTLDTGEANGLNILEFGLLTYSGRLYARKVRGAILEKISAISLTGAWTITF